MRRFFLIAAFIVLTESAGTLPAFAGENKEETQIDAAFVVGKCTVCHQIDKICSKAGKENNIKWTRIIREMVRKGAALDESEQTRTAYFLTELPKGKNSLCP